jgi:hypothetical protein
MIRINDNVLNKCEGKIISDKNNKVGDLGRNIEGVKMDK